MRCLTPPHAMRSTREKRRWLSAIYRVALCDKGVLTLAVLGYDKSQAERHRYLAEIDCTGADRLRPMVVVDAIW